MSVSSGISKNESLYMAIDIHCGKTVKMDYELRNFNPDNWKWYPAYIYLKDLSNAQPTLSLSSNSCDVDTPDGTDIGVGSSVIKISHDDYRGMAQGKMR